VDEQRVSAMEPAERPTLWVYHGVWAVVSALFRVPRGGPSLPVGDGDRHETFHPARGYLSYLKLWFWLVLVPLEGMIVGAGVAIYITDHKLALILAPVELFLMLVPGVIAYIAIHLRYDNMWYVLTDRSLRIRRGIWVITEMTFTFENIQNVKVRSGPVQRAFGIADVIVETAAAGADSSGHTRPVSNQGLIEGIAHAHRMRDLIMSRVRRSTSAGLGDESGLADPATAPRSIWTPAHLEVLREILDEVRTIRAAG